MQLFLVIFLIAASAFLLYVLTVLFDKIEECPRCVLGYNCKGKDCDHSEEELQKAYKAIHVEPKK